MNFEPLMLIFHEEVDRTDIADPRNIAKARAKLATERAKDSWLIKYYCARAIAAIDDGATRALRVANMRRIHGATVMDAIELSARAEYRLNQWYRSHRYNADN